MTVTVQAFAGAREILGRRTEVTLSGPATVGDVWEQLCAAHPALADFRLRGLAVNHQYVAMDTPLHDGDEVAVIPPVSGG